MELDFRLQVYGFAVIIPLTFTDATRKPIEPIAAAITLLAKDSPADMQEMFSKPDSWRPHGSLPT